MSTGGMELPATVMEGEEMREHRIRPRRVAVLVFAVAVALAAGTTSAKEAKGGRSSVRLKECYYGSGVYSLGACRDGQKCVRGTNDEDYWADGQCDQTSPGAGGYRQI